LIDRRSDRYALCKEQLIGAQAKGRRDQGLELVEILIDEVAEVVVDWTAPTKRAVHQIRGKSAIRRVERAAPQRRVKR
jgi:hypothetical protein